MLRRRLILGSSLVGAGAVMAACAPGEGGGQAAPTIGQRDLSLIWQVEMQPAKPFAFGRVSSTPFF